MVPTRELHEDERPSLAAHLLALEPQERRLRFGHPLSDEAVRDYVQRIDLSRDVVFVATDAGLALVGAAHLARDDGHAELGLSVLPRSRSRGIATALLERCVARARNWNLRVLFMNCLVENAAMMHLARKQGLQIAVSGAEAEAFVRLPRASLRSLAAETVADQIGLFDHAQKAHWLAIKSLWGAPAQTDPDKAPDA